MSVQEKRQFYGLATDGGERGQEMLRDGEGCKGQRRKKQQSIVK